MEFNHQLLDPRRGPTTLLAWILIATLLISAGLMFAQLGHYALWDDEAIDAIMAKGILSTGDTTGVVGSNIMGYRNGLLLNNFRVEGEPPFTAYAAAASMSLFGVSAWAARLPIALFGFAGIAILLGWLWQMRTDPLTAAVFCIALLGNVSFFLFARQCHYYGTAIFCFIAITYLYFNWDKRRLRLFAMGFCSAVLLMSNYSFLIVLYVCLFVDYVIWQRRRTPFSFWDLVVLFLPPFLAGLAVVAWWNPFHTQMSERLAADSVGERISLFFWHLRDLNRCEMWVGVLMLAAPIVAYVRKDQWLTRTLVAAGLYLVVATVLSTQSVKETQVSDVRYFSALIPLFLLIETWTLRAIFQRVPKLLVPAALLIFGTNLANGGGWLFPKPQSTWGEYIAELLNPPPEPFTPVAKWIREEVPPGASIWVMPDYMTYPLMFHAPEALYAWQFDSQNPRIGNTSIPRVHFRGEVPPDYLIFFGPIVQQFLPLLEQWQTKGIVYESVGTLDVFWKDLYRPELFWRTFRPISKYRLPEEAVNIFKKRPPEPLAP